MSTMHCSLATYMYLYIFIIRSTTIFISTWGYTELAQPTALTYASHSDIFIRTNASREIIAIFKLYIQGK